MLFKTVRTPCIGVCSTGIGDQVCRGCKRFAHEVIAWNSYTQDEKGTIVRRLDGFLAQVVANRLHVFDRDLLLAELSHQQISFREEASPYCWVFDLLKAGASQIDDLTGFGVRLLPEWEGCSLVELKQAIDEDYYSLSCAHFDRYFQALQGS
jgi:predicted Fe-S protein YdhL (DUF1289 family)